MKRILDLLVSAVGIAVLFPVLAAIAGIIRREDGGPVFYRGCRVGRGGREFRIFKFRTMVVNADRIGGPSTSGDDPRITRVGRILRRYKLDELPQLFNVLTGEMSLVGPRPEVKEYTDILRGEERLVLTARPGITDWASLWNSDEGSVLEGAPDPEREYLERIRPTKTRLQMKYVQEQSLIIDLQIVALTVSTVLGRRPGLYRRLPPPPAPYLSDHPTGGVRHA